MSLGDSGTWPGLATAPPPSRHDHRGARPVRQQVSLDDLLDATEDQIDRIAAHYGVELSSRRPPPRTAG